MRLSKFSTTVLVVWLASLVGLSWVLLTVRQRTMDSLDTAESRAAWEQWRKDVRQSQVDSGPVRRKPPSSQEPPALVLMRDRFPVLLTAALVTWSFFYAFTAVIVRGLASGQRVHTRPLRLPE